MSDDIEPVLPPEPGDEVVAVRLRWEEVAALREWYDTGQWPDNSGPIAAGVLHSVAATLPVEGAGSVTEVIPPVQAETWTEMPVEMVQPGMNLWVGGSAAHRGRVGVAGTEPAHAPMQGARPVTRLTFIDGTTADYPAGTLLRIEP